MRQPAIYIPHGGGPCFFMPPMPGLPPDHWDRMAAYLRGIAATLPEPPKAALVISAHWEAERFTLGERERHDLLFDYYGFPEHTYHLQYPAAGSPALAARAAQLLEQAGIACAHDRGRGIDHGVFIPFMLMFPKADLPIVPMSLRHDLDARAHLAAGTALAPLRDEGVLVVASGFSYHNLRGMFHPDARSNDLSRQFDHWLAQSVASADPERRAQALAQWGDAPGAHECHPRAEHLMPLMVASGAGDGQPGRRPYTESLLGKSVSAVQFG